jgi:hypothetical protein
MILETVQVLVSFAAFTNRALIGFGSFIVFGQTAVAMFFVVFQAIGILVRLVTSRNGTLVWFVSVKIYRRQSDEQERSLF